MKLTKYLTILMVAALLLTGCMAPAANSPVTPQAGHWQTWVLASSDALRPAPPPDQAGTMAEIAQLKALAAERDAEAKAQVAYWDAGSPSYRWIEMALAQYKSKPPVPGVRIARGLALMNVAIYDAIVAAWEAKYTYNRPRPSSVDPALTTLVTIPNSPSYPSEHAVAAGAAASILGYLYPDDAQSFADQAAEAAHSRLLAGANYPSDVEAGLELGRQVAEQVIARAMADGSDAVWDGQMPTGPGYWNGENPQLPLVGTWKTWVLPSGDALRPPPPLAYDSPELAAELSEIKAITHTWQLDQRAMFWQTLPGIFDYWYDNASRHIFEHHLDSNPPEAARIYAALSVSQYETWVACWEAKYTYWAIRPFQMDKEVVTLFPTPNHPSYPSGHACYLGAVAATLGHLFPEQAEFINGVAEEQAESRVYAGIHFRSDIVAGLALGRAVSDLVVERVEEMVQPAVETAAKAASSELPPGSTKLYEMKTEAIDPAAQFEVIETVFSYVPGAWSSPHTHGGQTFNTVLEGEVTLREHDTDKVFKVGESWSDTPDTVHQIGNEGTKNARLLTTFLVPAGAQRSTAVETGIKETTLGPTGIYEMKTEAIDPATQFEVIQAVLDFAPGVWTPPHTHGGQTFNMVLDGELTLHEKDTEQVFKAGDGWSDTPDQVHTAGNAGDRNTRLFVTFLLPQGAQLTTVHENMTK